MKLTRLDLLLMLLLALLPLLFFWRLITPNPADRMQITNGDFTEQYFPLRAFSAQAWVRGQIPLWNPYLYGGQPALADIQSGALYPPHVLQALMLGWGGPFLLGQEIGFPVSALQWQVILHFSVVAVGMYLLMRRLALQQDIPPHQARFGALVASLTVTYSGYLTGFPVQQMTILQVSAWLPWVMLGVVDVTSPAKKKSHLASGILIGALATTLALLAGHPQTVLYIVYLVMAYALFCTIRHSPIRPFAIRKFIHSPFVITLLMLLLGGLMASAQLLPTLEFIRHSVRANLAYEAVSRGLPLTEIVAVTYPGFFGGSPQYIGLVSLMLALLVLWVRPHAEVIFWAGVALISLMLAFGGNSFLYPLFYLFAPGFEMVRQQERVFLLYSFSMAILAGYGAILLVSPLPKPVRKRFSQFEHGFRRLLIGWLILLLIFIYGSTASTARGDEVNLFFGLLHHHLFGLLILAGLGIILLMRRRRWLRRWWGMAILVSWLVFNLFTVNWQFNLEKPTDPPPFTPNGVTSFLQQQTPPSRIVSGGLLPNGNSSASVYELQDLTGNTPLQLANMAQFLTDMPAWRLWQLLHVQYILSDRDIGDAGLIPVFAEGEQTVYQMGDPFDRAWLVGEVTVISEAEQAIAHLADDTVMLRQQAVVAEPLLVKLDSTAPAGSVELVSQTPTMLRFKVVAHGQQLLVISQTDYPGWQAMLDAQSRPRYLVNAVQQGIIIPAGEHIVELVYWPWSFRLGMVMSALGLAIWLVVSFWVQQKKRGSKTEPLLPSTPKWLGSRKYSVNSPEGASETRFL
ncbi:hypothetical protein QUF64_09310 [Anaerolineales bacterium HSG6]|nr:hypothetical protein [Anaerolineales bacterium HSG6]